MQSIESSLENFSQLLPQFSYKSQYSHFLRDANLLYELKPFHLQKITVCGAKKMFQGLMDKYERKIYEQNVNSWFQNQRLLFIWTLVCYLHKSQELQKQPTDLEFIVWERMSKVFFNKNPLLLKFQYLNILKKKGRASWSPEEDEVLRNAVNDHQPGKWNEIAKDIFFNSSGANFKYPKQCRERWQNHLNPEVEKGAWSLSEDDSILKGVEQFGKKWSRIREKLGLNRTEHMIKNRYYSLSKTTQSKEVIKEDNSELMDNVSLPPGIKFEEEPALKREGGLRIEQLEPINKIKSPLSFFHKSPCILSPFVGSNFTSPGFLFHDDRKSSSNCFKNKLQEWPNLSYHGSQPAGDPALDLFKEKSMLSSAELFHLAKTNSQIQENQNQNEKPEYFSPYVTADVSQKFISQRTDQ